MKNNNLIKDYEPQRFKDMNINDIIDYLKNSGDRVTLIHFNDRLKKLNLNYIDYKTYLEDNYIDDYTSKDVEQFYTHQADVINAIYIMDNDIGNIDISIQEVAKDIDDANLFTITEEGFWEKHYVTDRFIEILTETGSVNIDSFWGDINDLISYLQGLSYNVEFIDDNIKLIDFKKEV